METPKRLCDSQLCIACGSDFTEDYTMYDSHFIDEEECLCYDCYLDEQRVRSSKRVAKALKGVSRALKKIARKL